MALFLVLPHHIELAIGRNLRLHHVDTDLAGDGIGGIAPVAGEQNRLQSALAQGADGFGAGGADRVGDSKHAGERAIERHEYRCRRKCRVLRRDGIELGGGNAVRMHEGGVADGDAPSGDSSADAAANSDVEAGHLGQGAADGHRREYRVGEGVFAGLLDGGSEDDERVAIHGGAARELDRCGARPALGDGARLVEQHEVDLLAPLDGLTAAHQDAELRAATGTNHDGGGNGESHGAGAGNDEDGNGRDKRIEEARLGTGEVPGGGGGEGDEYHHRHEDPGDAIGEALDGCPGFLGLAHEADDARQHRVGTDAGSAHAERTGAIDGAAHHLVSGAALDGERLTGEHRFVDAALSVHDGAVGSDGFAGAHAELVTRHEAGDGELFVATSANDADGLGTQREQAIECRRGTALCALLEPLSGDDERNDADDRFVVDDRRDAVPLEPGGCDGGGDAEEQGGTGAERNEGVHVGSAVLRGGPGAHVEVATVNEHHGERQAEQCPAQDRCGGAIEVHGDEHRDGEDREGNPGLDATRVVVGRRMMMLVRRDRHARAVAGLLDGSDQLTCAGDRRVKLDGRGVGHEVDVGTADAGGVLEDALDAAAAGSASHAGHVQAQPAGAGCTWRRVGG